MNNSILIALVLFLGMSQQLSHLQKIKMEAQKVQCFPKIIEMFLPNHETPQNEFYMSEAASPYLKSVCPTMSQTCCSKDQFSELTEMYQQGKLKSKELISNNTKILKVADDYGRKVTQKIANDADQKLEHCTGSEEGSKMVNELIQTIQNNKETITTLITDAVNKADKTFAGFACEICDSKMASKIAMIQGTMKLAYNLGLMREVLEELSLFFKYNETINQIITLIDTYHCLNEQDYHSMSADDFFIDESAIHQLDLCLEMNDQTLLESAPCKELIENYGYANRLPVTGMIMGSQKKIMDFEHYDSFMETANPDEFEVIYYPHNPSAEMNFKNLQIAIVPDSGLEMKVVPSKLGGNAGIMGFALVWALTLILS